MIEIREAPAPPAPPPRRELVIDGVKIGEFSDHPGGLVVFSLDGRMFDRVRVTVCAAAAEHSDMEAVRSLRRDLAGARAIMDRVDALLGLIPTDTDVAPEETAA